MTVTQLFGIVLVLGGVVLGSTPNELSRSHLEKYKGVQYLTFSRSQPDVSADIRDVHFIESSKTVFVVHGYSSTSLEQPFEIKNAIFESDSNVGQVVVVSWMLYSTISDMDVPSYIVDNPDISNIAPFNYYEVAMIHVGELAKDISKKIQYLQRDHGGEVQIFGHSLGAHVAGQTGRLFKSETGKEIDSIIALDPAAPGFEKNMKDSLQATDAKRVEVFHTNTDHYGLSRHITDHDVFVNGGKKHPECRSKLMADICSHSKAWQVGIDYLRNRGGPPTTTIKSIAPRFVICLDVSTSMELNNRLERAVEAAKQIVSGLKEGSYMGIVSFSDRSFDNHDIVLIESQTDRASLQSSIPLRVIRSTNIGAGLRRSMEMLKALPYSAEFCSTIFLLSDGEHNVGEPPLNVVPELQRACITVNSIGLGVDASNDLEEISVKTNGQVTFVSEVESLSKTIFATNRALTFAYESEMDPDILPIRLPSKTVELLHENEISIPFTFEKSIGSNSTFSILSDNINRLSIKLNSPSGREFDSACTTNCSYEELFNEKRFHIPMAESGQWSVIVTKLGGRRRRHVAARSAETWQVIAAVSTHPISSSSEGQSAAVRLEATISNRTLEYPHGQITIAAELRAGKYPVIDAIVLGHIEDIEQPLRLHDDGAFPDTMARDGVYSASISKLPNVRRYAITVTAVSNGTTRMLPEEMNYFYSRKATTACVECKNVDEFQREVHLGSIKLLSTANADRIPPSRVVDLKASVLNETARWIALEWTIAAVVDDDSFVEKSDSFDIRALVNGSRFEDEFRLDESRIVDGSLNVSAASAANGKIKMRVVFEMPIFIWTHGSIENDTNVDFSIIFVMKSIGSRGAVSDLSNLASAFILKKKKAETETWIPWTGITGFIFIAVALLLLLAFLRYIKKENVACMYVR